MPRSPEPVCGLEFGRIRCRKRGQHLCQPRVEKVLAFFGQLLCHTKGDAAREPFVPADWQRERVLEPLFGRVIWDAVRRRYVRQYRTLYLYVARKNGKSELLAGIVLYMLVGEGGAEESGEIYGLALDREQANHVYRAAARMVDLNRSLRQRLEVIRSKGRIVDQKKASFFAVVAGDAPGALGSNPSCAYIDELLTQPDRLLYDAIRTGMGARAEPLLLLATTAENDPGGFAATEREWSQRVLENPELDPTRLVVMYQAPEEADWTDERTWYIPNPALGDFLELRTLRDEFRQALNNPVAERAFRQYRLNQPVNAIGRAIQLDVWDRGGAALDEADLAGESCYGGLDLAASHDLAALCWDFPLDVDGELAHRAIWRIFTPRANLERLDRRTGGRASVWEREGWLTVTEGEVIDYRTILQRLEQDVGRFDVREIAYDPWGMTQLVQDLMDAGQTMVEMRQGYASMAAPTSELIRLLGAGRFCHGGNPIARWCAGNAVTRSDPAGNLKWDRDRSADKIDPIVAATMALARAMIRKPPRRSVYEDSELMVV